MQTSSKKKRAVLLVCIRLSLRDFFEYIISVLLQHICLCDGNAPFLVAQHNQSVSGFNIKDLSSFLGDNDLPTLPNLHRSENIVSLCGFHAYTSHDTYKYEMHTCMYFSVIKEKCQGAEVCGD